MNQAVAATTDMVSSRLGVKSRGKGQVKFKSMFVCVSKEAEHFFSVYNIRIPHGSKQRKNPQKKESKQSKQATVIYSIFSSVFFSSVAGAVWLPSSHP